MADAVDPNAELRALIEAAVEPPPEAELGPLRSLVRRMLVRVGRAHARHEQTIDRGLLREIERLQARIATLEEAVPHDRDESREWLGNLQREQDATRSELAEFVTSDTPLHGDGTIELETFDAGLGGKVVGFRGSAGTDSPADVYVGFEGYFRGSEQTIKDRQRAYAPLLTGQGPALDVGCGRGELLELMGEIGVQAAGIDVDAGMVEHCRRKGLDRVQQADALTYLEQLADDSLGAITALQVIEHLPYAQLVAFLRASRDTLRPGGRLIVETVNPHAPQALKHFWIDPTHQHPLFPEIVVALCRLTGFASAYIWYPQGAGDPDRDRASQSDYAVVAETAAKQSLDPLPAP